MRLLLGHAGPPATPDSLWSSWGTDPFVYTGLLLAGWLYLSGLRKLWGAAGIGRGVSRTRAASFLVGLVVCWVALESPIGALGSAVFWGHMLQHELLAVVAAPLLILGEPGIVVPRALPPRWRRRLGRLEHRLAGAGQTSSTAIRYVAAFLVFAASFWVWHAPTLYDAAARSDLVHSIQHLTFLVGAVLFWYAAISRRGRRNPLAGIALVFAGLLQGVWGGTTFVFANQPIYRAYSTTTRPWGLEPVEDLNIGGVIMLAAGPIMAFSALALIVSFLTSMERSEAGTDGGRVPVRGWSGAAPLAAPGEPRSSDSALVEMDPSDMGQLYEGGGQRDGGRDTDHAGGIARNRWTGGG